MLDHGTCHVLNHGTCRVLDHGICLVLDHGTCRVLDHGICLVLDHGTCRVLIALQTSALQVPPEYEQDPLCQKFDATDVRRTYCGMVKALDEGVGKTVATLKELNVLDDFFIVFTSDNGASNKVGASAWPLRGHKQSVYEVCKTWVLINVIILLNVHRSEVAHYGRGQGESRGKGKKEGWLDRGLQPGKPRMSWTAARTTEMLIKTVFPRHCVATSVPRSCCLSCCAEQSHVGVEGNTQCMTCSRCVKRGC